MQFMDFLNVVLSKFEDAVISEDSEGQVLIHTNLMFKSGDDMTLVPFVMKEDA